MVSTPEPNYARAAVYARYSSNLQKETSIVDQLRDCRIHVANNDGVVAGEFWDSAVSGETLNSLAGLRALLKKCWEGDYTVIVTESMDRISRDQADIAHIYRQLNFLCIPIFSIEDGTTVNPLLIGFRGTMNSMFLQALSHKTRRGQRGVVHSGRSLGPPPYGYRLANRVEGAQTIRGIREIHPEHAPIAHRIFKQYADGSSARAISEMLNAEGVLPPRGGKMWRHNYLVGQSSRSPMLRNLIYRGYTVAGMHETVRNPETGKRTFRSIPKSDWIIVPAPHLRIVEDGLWFAVQERIEHSAKPRPTGSPRRRKGAMPLTPLLKCAQCKGPIRTFARDRWACQNALNGDCTVPTFSLRKLELLVAQHLYDWVHGQVDWTALLQLAQDRHIQQMAKLENEIAETQLKIDRLTDAIETGTGSFSLSLRIATLDTQLIEQQREFALLSAPPHPLPEPSVLKRRIKEKVTLFLEKAGHSAHITRSAAAIALSEVIDRIDMMAGPGRSKAVITVQPNLMGLVRSVTETDDQPPDK